MQVEVARPRPNLQVQVAEDGMVSVPPPPARYVVISDIDGTVMYTGVAIKAKMLWRLFVQDAESRTAVPGLSDLYRALHQVWAATRVTPCRYPDLPCVLIGDSGQHDPELYAEVVREHPDHRPAPSRGYHFSDALCAAILFLLLHPPGAASSPQTRSPPAAG